MGVELGRQLDLNAGQTLSCEQVDGRRRSEVNVAPPRVYDQADLGLPLLGNKENAHLLLPVCGVDQTKQTTADEAADNRQVFPSRPSQRGVDVRPYLRKLLLAHLPFTLRSEHSLEAIPEVKVGVRDQRTHGGGTPHVVWHADPFRRAERRYVLSAARLHSIGVAAVQQLAESCSGTWRVGWCPLMPHSFRDPRLGQAP